jgi:hypothetical protein
VEERPATESSVPAATSTTPPPGDPSATGKIHWFDENTDLRLGFRVHGLGCFGIVGFRV